MEYIIGQRVQSIIDVFEFGVQRGDIGIITNITNAGIEIKFDTGVCVMLKTSQFIIKDSIYQVGDAVYLLQNIDEEDLVKGDVGLIEKSNMATSLVRFTNRSIFVSNHIIALCDKYPFEQTATKYDQSKIPIELLSPTALNMIAEVMAFGAKKYEAHNWRKGMKHTRLLGASLRHILSYIDGEDFDPESNLCHLAHAGCCIMFLLEYIAKDLGEDDRYKHKTNKGGLK